MLLLAFGQLFNEREQHGLAKGRHETKERERRENYIYKVVYLLDCFLFSLFGVETFQKNRSLHVEHAVGWIGWKYLCSVMLTGRLFVHGYFWMEAAVSGGSESWGVSLMFTNLYYIEIYLHNFLAMEKFFVLFVLFLL